MNELFDILRRKNLLDRKGLRAQTISSMSIKQIFDVAELIRNQTEPVKSESNNNIFAHSASLSLWKTPDECAQPACRVAKVEEMARFALLYSDRVYINNFFSDYEHYIYASSGEEQTIKKGFATDLYMLLLLKPLLEKKYVVLYTPQVHCPNCWADERFGLKARKRLNKAQEQLSKEYFLNTKVALERVDGQYRFKCTGQEPYFDHELEMFAIPPSLPEVIASKPRILNKVSKGESIVLPQVVRKQLGLHKELADSVVRSISYELSLPKFLNAYFLTDKMLHVSFLQALSDNKDIEYRNAIASQHLTSLVPFMADLKFKDLITLRKREEEAFIQYRKALNEAIKEFRSEGANLTEKEAKALYRDVIAPRLSALERRVRHAKRDLVSKAYRPIIAVVGAISFGIYTGIIPAQMAELAKLVGFTKIASDILEKALALGDAERVIKDDDLYFLWKVKKSSK